MRYCLTIALSLCICYAACSSSPVAAQELVPPPPPIPTSVGQAASEASSLASQSLAAGNANFGAGPIAQPAGVGFRPGGFFHALSTTKTNICLKFKQSPLGGLLAEMRKPLSTITGGLVPPAATPSAAEVAAAGPQGTAAQIQAINIDAPKRVNAVQQLQGLDVRYHPEAAQTLIAALRADPSDCVRLEAARTIGTLRVCTKPIAEALRISVEGAETDGNPAELSPAVKRQAAISLSCCLNCLSDSQTTASPEARPEYPVTQASFTTTQSTTAQFPTGPMANQATAQTSTQTKLSPHSRLYYQQVTNAPKDLVSQVAQRTLVKHQSLLVDPLQGPVPAQGDNSLMNPLAPAATPVHNSPAGLLEIWRASGK